jgi:hypothetical protein
MADVDELIREAEEGGGACGRTWGNYYRAGMWDGEAPAYKAGYVAALVEHRAAIAGPDREALIDFFTRVTIQGTPGLDGVLHISAESMADAVLESLSS